MIMDDEIGRIKDRNKRVEEDKAWETSYTRRAIIAVLTYGIVVIFLFSLNAPRPWINAIIPVIGFLLSTLTLRYCKSLWLKR